MVDFKKVHIFSEERGTGRRLLRENHYAMLSKQGVGRVFLQGGQMYYENGTPVPSEEAEGWGDLVDRLPDTTKAVVGFAPAVAPSMPVRQLTKTQWVYGPDDDQELCVAAGEYYGPDERRIDPADLPMWARDALAALSPRERERAGLLPLAVPLAREEEDEPPVARRHPRRATAIPVAEPIAREPVGIAASAGEPMLLEDDPWPQ